MPDRQKRGRPVPRRVPAPSARGKGANPLRIPDLAGWRQWLAKHHDSTSVVWLEFTRTGSGNPPSLSYSDALDEALCWGWIDSIVRHVDDDYYLRKFTPRTNPATWSAANLARIRRLLAEGRVQEPGLAAIVPQILAQGENAVVAQAATIVVDVPAELIEALEDNPEAAAFFATLAPSYRNLYLRWVASAKRPETRIRRGQEAARLLASEVKHPLK